MAAGSWTNSGGLLDTPGIPEPSGPHNVACADVMAENGLLVRLFYPTQARKDDGYNFASTTPHSNYTRAMFEIFDFQPVGLMTFFANNLIDSRCPALVEAPLLSPVYKGGRPPAVPSYPVIVMSHGLHGHRCVYSATCCDLASQGYVVAALEHKDRSACLTFERVPGGRGVAKGDYDKYINKWIPSLDVPMYDYNSRHKQLQQRCEEVSAGLDLLQSLNEGEGGRNMMGGSFDLSQFKGRLDTDAAAVMGHSFGGATTVVTLATNNRFKCGIAMDTWMFPVGGAVYESGVSQPLLFINSYNFQWAENVSSMMKLVTPPDATGKSRVSLVTLRDSTHFNQTDVGFVLPSYLNSTYRKTPLYLIHRVNTRLCVAHLNRYLIKDPTHLGRVPLLDGGKGSSRRVLYGTNVDWASTGTTPTNSNGNLGKLLKAKL